MKSSVLKPALYLTILVAFLITCTELEKEILVTTGEITSIQINSAEAAGNLVDLGDGVIQYGHYYSKSSDPAKDILHTTLGKPEGTGGFISQITGLEAGTKYYIVAYATGNKGSSFGDIKSFTTLPAKVPVLGTSDITAITTTSATSGGEITDEGGAPVTSRGVCWGTATSPTIEGTKTTNGSGAGSFSGSMTGLTPGTKYYVRAYAINSAGTGYGPEKSFITTAAAIPVMSATVEATEITETSAKSGGNITSDGGMPVMDRGVCFNITGTPTTADNKTFDGTGTGSFVSNLTGLTQGTKYYVRSYAENYAGTAYGAETSFTTTIPVIPPVAITNDATSLTVSSATLNGIVNANGFSTAVTFEYGTTSSYGNSVTATQSSVTGNSNTNVSAILSELSIGVTYHFRIKAVSTGGSVYGDDRTFSLSCLPADASTETATSVSATTAALNGLVDPNDFSTNATFEYGLTTTYGNSAIAAPDPVTGNSSTPVSSSITGLIPNTTYHYRLKVVSCGGTTAGSDQTFTTACLPPSSTASAATSVTGTTATLNGTVNANGFQTTVTFEYGLTTAYGNSKPATPATVDGNTDQPVTGVISGLSVNTTYHYRIMSVNCAGTYYSQDFTMATCALPTATATAATLVTNSTATLNGTINANGFSAFVTFEYGTTTSYGATLPATPISVTGSSNTAVNVPVTGLSAGTLYHYRLKSVNCGGTVYSSDITFATCTAPTAYTNIASGVTSTSATLKGTVYANGSSTTVTFEYGTTTSYGNSVNATPYTVTGTIGTSVSGYVTGLTPNTLYHYRVKTVNCGGTITSSDATFTTSIAIGDTYQGGKVAYIFQSFEPGYVSGQVHGIIAAPNDLANSFSGCWGVAVTGALGPAIRDGIQNTIDIINGCTSTTSAARICYDLTLNGYSDWYLPSRSELVALYTNRTLIGNFNTSAYYWTSTRESTSARYYTVSFITGLWDTSNYDSSDARSVRAIRYF